MRIAILGAAESGVGAAILAQKMGYEVFVSDMGTIRGQFKERLNAAGIPWEEGRHTEEEILKADEAVKSPGIPETAPMVCKLRDHGIPVVSEIEFASRFTNARTICITGSNGKTTTTSLIYHILRKAGMNVGLAGNIGRSFALQVAEGKHDTYVIELSSFQLDGMFRFKADVAVLLNITPDHLDRYGFVMQNYVNSKMRILQNMEPTDRFIYWLQDEHIPTELAKRAPVCRMLPFSDSAETGGAAYVETPAGDSGLGTIRIGAPVPFTIPVEEVSIAGKHNMRNAMAAALAALSAGVDEAVVREGLRDFPGVEHRLERVADVRGVHYVNDSKATNVDACYCALESMRTPVVLIIGGLDKGNDYNQLTEILRRKCRALVYLGADNSKLHDFFDSFGLPVRDVNNMRDCVAACAELAQEGDTVLLSPCCASFDLFHNMEDRGEQFKDCVRAL